MADYRRLISYIYNYEKGIKKNNVGFAKIELRNGQCKFTISCKAASLNGQKLQIYVFYRDNRKMIQILLAESTVKNGVFEWKGIANSENVMNTGYSFDRMGGLLLYYSLDKFYGTEWDEQKIVLERLIQWDEVQENESEESWKPYRSNRKESKVVELGVKEQKITEEVRGKTDQIQPVALRNKEDQTQPGGVRNKTDQTQPVALRNKENQTQPGGVRNKIDQTLTEVVRDERTYQEKLKEAEEAVNRSQEEIVKSILRSIDEGLEQFCKTENETLKTATSSGKREKGRGVYTQGTNHTVQAELCASEIEDKTASMTAKSEEIQISPEAAKLVGYRFINWYRSRESGFPVSREESASKKKPLEQIEPRQLEEIKSKENVNQLEDRKKTNAASILEEEMQSDLQTGTAYIGEKQTKDMKQLDRTSFYAIESEKEWNDKLEEVAKKKISTAERILQKYPSIYPFEDNEILACVRIEPGDIGLFPIENWVLGNNSFLLHGYYNFRHLIFAKRKTETGEEYILGVPGIYQNREKFMAKMFGFTRFKCSKVKEQKTGEFGYWYVTVNM